MGPEQFGSILRERDIKEMGQAGNSDSNLRLKAREKRILGNPFFSTWDRKWSSRKVRLYPPGKRHQII